MQSTPKLEPHKLDHVGSAALHIVRWREACKGRAFAMAPQVKCQHAPWRALLCCTICQVLAECSPVAALPQQAMQHNGDRPLHMHNTRCKSCNAVRCMHSHATSVVQQSTCERPTIAQDGVLDRAHHQCCKPPQTVQDSSGKDDATQVTLVQRTPRISAKGRPGRVMHHQQCIPHKPKLLCFGACRYV